MDYIKKPMLIEDTSMQIIESEMVSPSSFTDNELKIVKRVIHTTADFEYENIIEFSKGAIECGIDAVKKGVKIYSDTNMISVGVNRVLLKEFGIEIVNYVHDEDVVIKAKELGITRSMVAMEKAIKDDSIDIFLIGNAPTALNKLIECCDELGKSPSLIVGVPVGFVGAVESKDNLASTDYNYITIRGRKGGSTVTVAIMNAILKIVKQNG